MFCFSFSVSYFAVWEEEQGLLLGSVGPSVGSHSNQRLAWRVWRVLEIHPEWQVLIPAVAELRQAGSLVAKA